MITDASHRPALAAAYVRGGVGEPDLDDGEAIARGERDGLRLHRFKRTNQRVSIDHVLNHIVAVSTR